MKLYFAGNFPQMKKPELEKGMKIVVESLGFTYRRLISFYYPEDSQNLINLKEEKEVENKKRKLVKRF